jgi:tRNA pseudouridine38-40 synthase
VEARLEQALSTITRTEVAISTAGRTDAGVHARGQVVSCDLPADTNIASLVRSVNGLCGPHIAVADAEWVDNDFDARRSATWRRYRYSVWNSPVPDPLLLDRAWHVWRPMSLPLMNLACDALVGEHDFSAFCRKPDVPEGQPEPSMNRYVFDATWREEGEGVLVFEIRANAFCHQMVRSVVGFLVDVGQGKRPPSDTRAVMLARDRNHGSQVAPPHGLVLWDVGYDGVRIHP